MKSNPLYDVSRKGGLMSWLKQFNDTIDFIENNLTEDISAKDIEKVSFSSSNHFNRMFFVLSGMTLNEYIRKRRLSLAASDIVGSNNKIIDVAYKYQYKTPEAFSKAFKQFHKITPREARKETGNLISFPKLSFQLTIKGGEIVEYKITKKDNLNFIGYSIDVTTKNEQNFKDIPAFWQEVMADERFMTLLQHADELNVVGICYDWNLGDDKFKYMIGIRNSEVEIEGTNRISFEPDVFAEFKAVGKLPESLQKTTDFIYREWFPSSNYEHSAGPEIEVYTKGDTTSDDYVCYYLVPVQQKK